MSFAASEKAVFEHFSAPLFSIITVNSSETYERMGLTTEVYSQATTLGEMYDTANMQCKLCASYFQEAPSNQASYSRSLPDDLTMCIIEPTK
jgi:hypothetical protein